MVATNDVHYHEPARRQLQDIVTCIREKCTIYNAGFRLHPNAERYLNQKKKCFACSGNILMRYSGHRKLLKPVSSHLDELKYEYPEEITTDGRTPQEELTFLGMAGCQSNILEMHFRKKLSRLSIMN